MRVVSTLISYLIKTFIAVVWTLNICWYCVNLFYSTFKLNVLLATYISHIIVYMERILMMHVLIGWLKIAPIFLQFFFIFCGPQSSTYFRQNVERALLFFNCLTSPYCRYVWKNLLSLFSKKFKYKKRRLCFVYYG